MKQSHPFSTFRRVLLGALAALSLTTGVQSAKAVGHDWVNLDSDLFGVTIYTDRDLVNPWGIVPGPAGNIWVSDNGTGLSTRYDDETGAPLNSDKPGSPFPAIAILSSSANLTLNSTNAIAAPTGIVLNHPAVLATGTEQGFLDPNTGTPAWFLYASEDGAISAYSPVLTGSTAKTDKTEFTGTAAKVIDNSAVVSGTTLGGAVYKGIALAITGTLPQVRELFVTNFATGNIEAYDKNYKLVRTFSDTTTKPSLSGTQYPANAYWAPFNIKRIAIEVAKPVKHVERFLFVTYAVADPATGDDVKGAGNGFIDVFSTQGALLLRFASGGDLNSPWGMAYARLGFGTVKDPSTGKLVPVKNSLLVGNFGDGLIHAYDMSALLADIQAQQASSEIGGPGATLHGPSGDPLRFEGLWALHFGRHAITNKVLAADDDDLIDDGRGLFFSAGFSHEGHGLMGRIFAH